VKLLLCSIFVFLPLVLAAQELVVDESLPKQSSSEQPSVDEPVERLKPSRPIEEITVVGQQSLARLGRLVVDKEDEIFAFFNENNSADKFDIICKRERKTGSYISRRVCEPKFLRDFRGEKAREFRLGFGVYLNQRELVELAGEDFEQLQNEMTEMMRTHKEYSDALADLTDLSENYESHRVEYFSDN
jgi:hypothetical protein